MSQTVKQIIHKLERITLVTSTVPVTEPHFHSFTDTIC